MAFYDGNREIGRTTFPAASLRVVTPAKRDTVMVVGGEHRGTSGIVIGVDPTSGDAIIKVDNSEIKVLRLTLLTKTSPH